jgi:hypothetical protein
MKKQPPTKKPMKKGPRKPAPAWQQMSSDMLGKC